MAVAAVYVGPDRNRTDLPLVGAAVVGGVIEPVFSTATNGRNTDDFAVMRARSNYGIGRCGAGRRARRSRPMPPAAST